VEKIDYPDRMIFDLDPAPDVPFDAVKLAARDLRHRLESRGLACFLKCTGGKGLHVTVPLAGKDNWEQVKAFCAAVADEIVKEVPVAYVATMSKSKRTGKIFIDYFRNDYTATAIADYSVRARPGAPVALPLEWQELDKLRAANQFTIAEAPEEGPPRRSAVRKSAAASNLIVDQPPPRIACRSQGTPTRPFRIRVSRRASGS
jgi:bifunctional non-homologous end joining protein LigD